MKKNSNKNIVKTKTVLYSNKRVVITNFYNIKEILEEEIKIDKLVVYGKKLKLKSMDNYMIEIIGEIEGVKYEDL